MTIEQRKATADDIVDELYRIGMLLGDMFALMRDQAQANAAALYCPPSEYCPGGLRLRLSTVKDEKRSEEDRRDRFYHPLPESEWHDLDTKQGTFHVRSHNVWRSKALSYEEAAGRGLIHQEDDGDADTYEQPEASLEPRADDPGDSSRVTAQPATLLARPNVERAPPRAGGDPPWLRMLASTLRGMGIETAEPVAEYLKSLGRPVGDLSAACEAWLGDDQSGKHVYELAQRSAEFAKQRHGQPEMAR